MAQPTVRMNCPHCDTLNSGFILRTQTKIDTFDHAIKYLVLAICGACAGGAIISYVHVNSRKNSPIETETDPSSNGWRVVGTYPKPVPPRVPEYAPAELQSYFRQAESALRRKDFDASGAMSRKVVDVSAKQLLADDAFKFNNIKDRIDELARRGKLTPDLKDWAHHVRLGGNVAAHDEEPYTEGEATELLDFADLYLTYVYTLPTRIADRRQPKTPSADSQPA